MQKILSFDFVKLFMALLIVAIHVYPFSSVSSELDFFFTHVFCRIGVPFFLMTTGYFVLSRAMKDRSVLKKYTIKPTLMRKIINKCKDNMRKLVYK